MDPVTTLQWVNAGSNLLNSLKSGAGSAPGYAVSGPANSKADIDFSGFTVATGHATANGANIKKSPADQVNGASSDAGSSSISPGLVVGLASLAGLLWPSS